MADGSAVPGCLPVWLAAWLPGVTSSFKSALGKLFGDARAPQRPRRWPWRRCVAEPVAARQARILTRRKHLTFIRVLLKRTVMFSDCNFFWLSSQTREECYKSEEQGIRSYSYRQAAPSRVNTWSSLRYRSTRIPTNRMVYLGSRCHWYRREYLIMIN